RAIADAGERCTAVLIRLAQDYGAVRPEPLRWFARAADETASFDTVGALLVQLPWSTLTLREVAANLSQRAVQMAREQGRHEALLRHLNDLSFRLSDLGRKEEALVAISEAVPRYRELAASRPSDFRPHLAMSLNNLAGCLSDLGRKEEALAAIDEAVAI